MTTTAIVPLREVEQMAEYVVQSGLFGMKTVPQAAALMLLCQAKGMHPMEAVEEYHIIQGKNTTKAERMLAKFQAAGGKVEWHELNDTRGEATFSHPLGGSVRIDWDIERAKRAGLAGKDNWRNYARAMLRSRIVSEGVRTVLPGATNHAYTPEEAADIPVERDITPPPSVAELPKSGVAALAARLAKPAAPPAEAPPPDPTLAELREQAMAGTEALKAAWERLTPVHRKSLSGELDALKAAAAEADERAPALPLEAA